MPEGSCPGAVFLIYHRVACAAARHERSHDVVRSPQARRRMPRGRLRKLDMTHIDSARPLADPEKAPEPTATTPQAQHTTDGAGAALRALARRVHFYAGLFIGPFLLIAAVSGFFYALSPSIEKVVYHDLTTASSSEHNVGLDTQVATARQVFPGLELNSVIPGTGGQNTRILFDDPSLESESYTRVAFVDPAMGNVDGESIQYGSGQALPLRTWLSEMHRRLHLGEPGRLYSELAASWLAPITLFGLYIWWDQRRQSRASVFRRSSVDRTARRGTRSEVRAKHAVLGAWAAIGFLGLSATGLTWSTYAGANISDLRAAMSWTTPTMDASAGDGEHAAHGGGAAHGGHTGHMATGEADHREATIDDIHAGAVSAGLADPIQLAPPAGPGEAWTATETRRSYAYGPSSAALDPRTGDVVERLDFADYPLAAKLSDWGIRAHMGFLFGLANQLLLAAVAGALVLIVIRGYAMWWKRRPTREGALPAMPRPGALLRLAKARPVMTTVAAIGVAGLCVAFPLLGISLAAFVLLDVAIALVRKARREARA